MVHHGVSAYEERIVAARMPATVDHDVEGLALGLGLHPAPVHIGVKEAAFTAVLHQQPAYVALRV